PRQPPGRLRVHALLVLARRHLPQTAHRLRPRTRLLHESGPRPEDQVRSQGRRGHRPAAQRRQLPPPLRLPQGTSRPPRPAPPAYTSPKERRAVPDRLRARPPLARRRPQLYGHFHTAPRQPTLPPVSRDVKYNPKRAPITADIADPFVRRRVETHLALLEPLDTTIRRLEAEIEDAAQEHYPTELAVLQSTPGVGLVLSLTILLEIDAIDPFAPRHHF